MLQGKILNLKIRSFNEFTGANWTTILTNVDRFLALRFIAVPQLAQNHTSLKHKREHVDRVSLRARSPNDRITSTEPFLVLL